jgi:hypothetical protein
MQYHSFRLPCDRSKPFVVENVFRTAGMGFRREKEIKGQAVTRAISILYLIPFFTFSVFTGNNQRPFTANNK